MGKYVKGAVNERLDIGALANATTINTDFTETVSEQMRVSSIEAMYSLTGYTKGTNDGPILVGIAHSDYTDGEIEAWIDNVNTWDFGDLSQQEVANRLIRKIGVFRNPDDVNASSRLNNGNPIKTKLNWEFKTGQTLQVWAYNMGTSPVAGGKVDLMGHINLWRK